MVILADGVGAFSPNRPPLAGIEAFVVEATDEQGLVMSLVENIARRQHRAIDLLHDIEGMKRRGHSEEQIAEKTDLTVE